MATTVYWYANALANAFGSLSAGNAPNIDYLSDTIKIMLCTSSYTPNQDTNIFKSDVSNEVSDANYTAGGATIPNKTLTYDSATNILNFGGDDVTWAGVIPNVRYAVIYDATPSTDATRPLLAYIDFGADISLNGVHAPSGYMTITAA